MKAYIKLLSYDYKSNDCLTEKRICIDSTRSFVGAEGIQWVVSPQRNKYSMYFRVPESDNYIKACELWDNGQSWQERSALLPFAAKGPGGPTTWVDFINEQLDAFLGKGVGGRYKCS